MASITLRSLSSPTSAGATVKNAPLTNAEVDANFDAINAAKVERNGSLPMTGKLTLVAPSTGRASIRVPEGDEPTTPAEGDIWNAGGTLRFAKTTSVFVDLLNDDNLEGSVNQIVVTKVGDSVVLSTPQNIATTSNVRFNSLGIGMAASGTAGRIDAAGDIVGFSTSDERFKNNIVLIDDALAKVKSLRGVMFDWDKNTREYHGYSGHDTGLIAQDLLNVLPEVVQERQTGYLAVKYEKTIGLLVEAIKELAEKVETLEDRLAKKGGK